MTPTIFGDDFQLAPPRTTVGLPTTPLADDGSFLERPAAPPDSPAWSESTLTRALVQALREASPHWCAFPQVPSFVHDHEGRPMVRLIDVVAVHSNDLYAVAFEVKTRRQDFVADVENPAKQDPWRGLRAHFYVAPTGVIDPVALPSKSGLIEVSAGGHVSVTIPAPTGERGLPTWLTRNLIQRSASLVSFHQGWVDRLGDLPNTAVLLERAHRDADRNARALQRARETAEAWRMLAATQGHLVPCRDCGAAIKPTRISAGVPGGWRHAQPHLTLDCSGSRTGVRPREDP